LSIITVNDEAPGPISVGAIIKPWDTAPVIACAIMLRGHGRSDYISKGLEGD